MARVFRRLTAPAVPYYTGTEGESWPYRGYGWLNGDPASPDSQAPAATTGATLHNNGTFFVCYNEGSSTGAANRPHAALATNIDILDEFLHKPLAISTRIGVNATASGTIVLTGGTFWTGSEGEPTSELFRVVDVRGHDLTFNNSGDLTQIYCVGITQGGVSVSNTGWVKATVGSPVTFSFVSPLPQGQALFFCYSEKQCLATLLTSALSPQYLQYSYPAAAQDAISKVATAAANALSAFQTQVGNALVAIQNDLVDHYGNKGSANTWLYSNEWSAEQVYPRDLPEGVDSLTLLSRSTFKAPAMTGDGVETTYRIYRNGTEMLLTSNAIRVSAGSQVYKWSRDDATKDAWCVRLQDGRLSIQKGAPGGDGTWSTWRDSSDEMVDYLATSEVPAVAVDMTKGVYYVPFADSGNVCTFVAPPNLDNLYCGVEVRVSVGAYVTNAGNSTTFSVVLEYYDGSTWVPFSKRSQTTAVSGHLSVHHTDTLWVTSSLPHVIKIRARVMWTGSGYSVYLVETQSFSATMHSKLKGVTDYDRGTDL